MNTIRSIQTLNARELEANTSTSASWHADYRDTAYIYIGGLPFSLSEGDILTIFSQYGEPTYVNLIRDKESGKSKGFAFLKYEDQRSTDLAVDNLGGASVLGRVLRVDHTRYKRREGEEEEGMERERERGLKGDGGEGSEREEENRPLLKEEVELQKLIKNHDEDDPMKEFLVREKKEEVAEALKRLERGGRDGEKRKHRHHHRREHRKDRSRRSRTPESEGERRHRHRHHHRKRSRSP